VKDIEKLDKFLLSRNNKLLYRGYDYHGKVLYRTLSNVLFSDEKRTKILLKISELLEYLIDSVKNIKKSYYYVFDKNDIDFN